MAAVAALFGLKAPVLATARVLELGGASGGNLIPIAAAGHAHTVNCRRESSIWM